MKEKLRDYIDDIFSDAPDCKKTRDLKEEMYTNLCDKYDDLLKDGKSESAAYHIAISKVGDISEIIDSIKEEYNSSSFSAFENDKEKKEETHAFTRPHYSPEDEEKIRKYKIRSGIMVSIAVMLYIICWVPLVVLSELFNDSFMDVCGIVAMMSIIAVATALLIINGYLKPDCLENKGETFTDESGKESKKGRKNPILKAIKSVLWTITVVVYMIISFATMAWHITWLIFLISSAIDNIIDAIFDILGVKYSDINR